MRPAYLGQTAIGDQLNLRFRFQINGTSDPDFQFPASSVKDVVRNSAGVFTITLPDGMRPPAMVGLVGSVLEATPAHDLIVKAALGDFTAASGTFKVTVVGADGTTAAEDPVDNDWVYLDVCFQMRTGTAAVGSV